MDGEGKNRTHGDFKMITAMQALEALDELESSARGDEPFNHAAAPVVRAFIECAMLAAPQAQPEQCGHCGRRVLDPPWPVMPPSRGQSHVLFEDGYAEGWAKCLDACKAMLSAAPQAQLERKRCEYCDGTGDVTSIDGEWLGACSVCNLAQPGHKPMTDGEKLYAMWHSSDANDLDDFLDGWRHAEAFHGIKEKP